MRTIVAGLLLFTFMIAPVWAQDAFTPLSQRGAQGHPPGTPPPTPAEIEIEKRLAKQRNQERFAQLRKETDHLLELATQLKKSVDEASDQTLSLEVIRKAEQIEKLAKQIRQKMVGE
ncbi:MAG TPA: hypothetical protein VES66_00230, partial [Terriglobales bacterium]|nr:hypothetical protein [Terriglobales bacterium]